MKELYEILQEFEGLEHKLVEIATENDENKRQELSRDYVDLLDSMRHEFEMYAKGVYIRTRRERDNNYDAATAMEAVRSDVTYGAKQEMPKLDPNKVRKFLLDIKGTPVTGELVWLLRESGYFNADDE